MAFSHRLSAVLRRSSRTRHVILASMLIGLVATPFAVAATTGSTGPLNGGNRNPSSNTSSAYTKETQIIGNVAQGQGGVAANTGGYVTRQSNKSDSGGGAIYGCRANTGKEACIAANNLGNGDAFRFQASPNASAVGVLRFGLDANKTFDKPPFVTNGTGVVKNLNADAVDGVSADALVDKGSLLFAVVGNDGTIAANRGVTAGGKATITTTKGNQVVSVPFSADVSKCAATASPTDPDSGTLAVAVGSDNKSVVVTEKNTSTATPQAPATTYGFHLQVTC